MARPKQQQERRKRHVVSFRLTDAEFAQLAQAAATANLRFNELARLFALSGGNRLIIKTVAASDPALLKRLDQLGNNLNQLVRRAHVTGDLPLGVSELCGHIEALVTEAAEKECGA